MADSARDPINELTFDAGGRNQRRIAVAAALSVIRAAAGASAAQPEIHIGRMFEQLGYYADQIEAALAKKTKAAG